MESTKKVKKNISLSDVGNGATQMNNLKMMDMFSLGLTILEVLNDGRSSRSHSELLKMRKEGMDFSQLIKSSASKLSKGASVME